MLESKVNDKIQESVNLLEKAILKEGWEISKKDMTVNIKLENDPDIFQINIQISKEYITFKKVFYVAEKSTQVDCFSDIADKINERINKRNKCIFSRIEKISKDNNYALLCVQEFDINYIYTFEFTSLLTGAVNNIISFYSLFGSALSDYKK